MAALIAPVMPRSTGAAAFESWASSPITTSPIRPAATPTAVSSTAAERPLETRTRVAADSRGISRKILARRGRATNAWSARFTGEKNRVILNGRVFCAGFCRRRDQFGFGARLLGAGVFRSFVLYTVICFVFRFHMFAQSRRMLSTFVRGVSLGFRTCRRAASLDFLAFVFGNLGRFGGSNFFRFLRGFHFLFRLVVEFRAANDGIGFSLVLHLLMLGFDEVRSEGRDLIFAQLCFPADLFHRLPNFFLLVNGNICRRLVLF